MSPAIGTLPVTLFRCTVGDAAGAHRARPGGRTLDFPPAQSDGWGVSTVAETAALDDATPAGPIAPGQRSRLPPHGARVHHVRAAAGYDGRPAGLRGIRPRHRRRGAAESGGLRTTPTAGGTMSVSIARIGRSPTICFRLARATRRRRSRRRPRRGRSPLMTPRTRSSRTIR